MWSSTPHNTLTHHTLGDEDTDHEEGIEERKTINIKKKKLKIKKDE